MQVSISDNTTACTPCGTGLVPNVAQSACVCADSNMTLSGGVCGEFGANMHAEYIVDCRQCFEAHDVAAWHKCAVDMLVARPAGLFCSTLALLVPRCPAACRPGTYTDANGDCTPCPTGMVSYQAASATCSRCPGGLVPATDQASCTCPGSMQLMCGTAECYCPMGSYKDAADGFECKVCPYGRTTVTINALSCIGEVLPVPQPTLQLSILIALPVSANVVQQHL